MSSNPNGHPIEALSALVDGELSPVERVEIRAHLAGCASCRALVDDLERVAALSREDVAPPVPGELRPRVSEALDMAGARHGWRHHLTRAPVLAAASIVLFAAVALLVRDELTRPPAGLPQGAIAESAVPSADPMQDDAIAKNRLPATEEQREFGNADERARRNAPGDASTLVETLDETSTIEKKQELEQRVPEAESEGDALASAAAPPETHAGLARDVAEGSREKSAADAPSRESAELRDARIPETAQDKEQDAAKASSPARAQSSSGPAAEPGLESAAREDAYVRQESGEDGGAAAVPDAATTGKVAPAPGTPRCALSGTLVGARGSSWTTSNPDGARELSEEAEAIGLGIVVPPVVAGEPVLLHVPRESWEAFRAWLADRQPAAPLLPPLSNGIEPPGADCVALAIRVVNAPADAP